MAGLQKAFFWLVQLLLTAAVDWTEPVHYAGAMWRKHLGTDYWVMVDPNGDLLHEEDIDWFLWHGWDLPPRPPMRLTPRRGGPYTRHGNRMATIPEEPVGAASSSSGGGNPLPANGNTGGGDSLPAKGSVEELQQALCQLQACLSMQSDRFDSRSFRAQLKRTIRRLCERRGIALPEWWDHPGLSTHQYKFKCHEFINDLLNANLSRLAPRP